MSIAQDVRYGLRMMRRQPGFSLLIVALVAVGVGANTAIFSLVNAILLRPLPYPNHERLVVVRSVIPATARTYPTLPAAAGEYLLWRSRVPAFDAIAAVRPSTQTMTGRGDPARVEVCRATASLLPMLGVRPEAGRLFREDEDREGRGAVALLGYGFWMERLGGDRSVIGQSITLDDTSYTVIGVLPRGVQVSERRAARLAHRAAIARGRRAPCRIHGRRSRHARRRLRLGRDRPPGAHRNREPGRVAAQRRAGRHRPADRRTPGVFSDGDSAARAGRRPGQARAGAARVGGRHGAAGDCRQPGEPAARARLCPRPGGGDSRRARREPAARDATGRDREPDAGRRRWRPRHRRRVDRRADAGCARAGGSAPDGGRRSGSEGACLRRGHLAADGRPLLAAAGVATGAGEPTGRPARRRTRRIRGRVHPVSARDAGRRGGRAEHRAGDGVCAAGRQLRPAGERRGGLLERPRGVRHHRTLRHAIRRRERAHRPERPVALEPARAAGCFGGEPGLRAAARRRSARANGDRRERHAADRDAARDQRPLRRLELLSRARYPG